MAVDLRSAHCLRATPDQVGQTAREQRQNLRGAFVMAGSLQGQHVALLDDVMTTGATLEKLARACKAAVRRGWMLAPWRVNHGTVAALAELIHYSRHNKSDH